MTKNIFLNTKPLKLFWMTAIPGGVSMLASSIYTVFESIFVGKLLGTTAFASLSMSLPIIIMNFALAELIGVGTSVLISIALGKNQEELANNYFTCAILLTVASGVLSGLILFFGSPLILQMLGAEGELLQLSIKYLRTYAVFSPVAPLMFAFDNYLRISGKLKTSMMLNILFSIITLGLELVFILVVPMELMGVALGTNIAMVVCVIIIFVMFLPNKLQLKFVKPKFSWQMIGKIYKNGFAPFLTNISGRVFSLVMNGLLLFFGGENAVAVYGALLALFGVVEQLLYGVADSLQPAIGYNYGAKRYDRVKAVEKYLLITAGAISIIFAGIVFAFPQVATILFLEDLSLLDMAIVAVRISCVAFLLKWFVTCIQCFFMALEKPLPAMIISTAVACIFPLLLIPILLPFELTGLWWNYPCAVILTSMLTIIIIICYKNKLFIEKNPKQEIFLSNKNKT